MPLTEPYVPISRLRLFRAVSFSLESYQPDKTSFAWRTHRFPPLECLISHPKIGCQNRSEPAVQFELRLGKKLPLRVIPYRGPFNTLAGRVMTALNRSRTAVTVIPIKRNGIRRIQTIGYKSKARRATGQQRTSRINHNRIFISISSPQ
jgi:hypothetical protein